MENIFIEFLPPWVETGLQPAFYDKESGTVLQQTARMYAKVNENVAKVNEYIQKFTELYNYVHNFFDTLDIHDQIDQILREYIDDGTFYETLNYDPLTQSLTLTFDLARS